MMLSFVLVQTLPLFFFYVCFFFSKVYCYFVLSRRRLVQTRPVFIYLFSLRFFLRKIDCVFYAIASSHFPR